MKKFYTLVLLMVAWAVTGYATTSMYQLDIDHADRVKVKINYEEKTGLKDGVNTFIIDDIGENGMYVQVEPVSNDYAVESVVNKAGTPVSVYSGQAYFYFDSSDANHYYKITTKDLAAARTATLNVECDAPEKLTLRFSGAYRGITLSSNTQQVRFDPESESPVMLEKSYNDDFYEVKLNDKDVEASYGSYSIDIKDGDKLYVKMTPPDVDYNYTITEMEGADGFVAGVTVDGTAVENYKSFKAHAGSTIVIKGNTSSYIFEKMELGTETVTYFYSDYSFKAKADTDIKIYARQPEKFTASFDIDDPDNVIIYTGYDPSAAFELKAGKQDLTFQESMGGNSIYVNIISSNNGLLKSVKKNGSEILSGSDVYTTVAKGDEFVIVTEKITRDWTAVMYVSGINDSHYFSFENTNTHLSICQISEGYNKFNFGAVDNPASLGFYPKNDTTPIVFVNGEVKSPLYAGSFSYELSMTDNDVVKVFINGEPDKYALSFVMPENTEGISVRRDLITPITDFATASTAHAGTVYHVTVPDAAAYTATLGDTPLTFDADNTAEFTPTADATLTVAGVVDGIEDVTVGSKANTEVYNMQGIRVAGDASNLPAGLYIIGGKKVLVK